MCSTTHSPYPSPTFRVPRVSQNYQHTLVKAVRSEYSTQTLFPEYRSFALRKPQSFVVSHRYASSRPTQNPHRHSLTTSHTVFPPSKTFITPLLPSHRMVRLVSRRSQLLLRINHLFSTVGFRTQGAHSNSRRVGFHSSLGEGLCRVSGFFLPHNNFVFFKISPDLPPLNLISIGPVTRTQQLVSVIEAFPP